MKLLIKLLILIAIALAVAVLSDAGNGHVIVFIAKYRLDFSVFTLLMLSIIGYVVLYYLTRLWINIHKLTHRFHQQHSATSHDIIKED